MTTIAKQILPIPEDSVQGSGSYTIPADKYGFVSMSTSASAYRASQYDSQNTGTRGPSQSASASSNANEQWLREGDTIDTQISNSSTSPYGRVRINATISCISTAKAIYASSYSSGTGSATVINATSNGVGRAYWSVSIFPIPKNNLPNELIEGN